MDIAKKLREWEAQGFIDAAQGARIGAYEASQARPVLLYALGGLGAFTVGTGLVSVVAANWDGIGKLAKLGLDLALLAGLGVLLQRASAAGRHLYTDILAGVYYALTLASVALLGQIYQLGAPAYQALLFWSAITFPFMTWVRGRLLGLVWLSGLLTTEGAALWELISRLEAGPSGGPFSREVFAALAAPAWALPFLLAHIPAFLRQRPVVARAMIESLWILLLVASCALACIFYVNMGDDRLHWGALPFVITLAIVGALLGRLYPSMPEATRGGLLAALGLTACIGVFGTTVTRDSIPFVAALSQVAMLACAAFVTLKLGSLRAFNAFTGLIALRVLIGYFELFGSMLDTGLGMIAGGGFTLLVAWLWKRKTPELAERLAGDSGAGGRHDA
jgi:uncharacterized membrane protein